MSVETVTILHEDWDDVVGWMCDMSMVLECGMSSCCVRCIVLSKVVFEHMNLSTTTIWSLLHRKALVWPVRCGNVCEPSRERLARTTVVVVYTNFY
jgi:hypothetical protein